jgi:hypothetical protein
LSAGGNLSLSNSGESRIRKKPTILSFEIIGAFNSNLQKEKSSNGADDGYNSPKKLKIHERKKKPQQSWRIEY